MKKYYLIIVAHFITIQLIAQGTLYMNKETAQAYEKGTRSWDGTPGPNYWVNFAEYDIEAEFDPDSGKLTGKESIVFHNNSPDTMRRITLKLKQNLYKKGAARDMYISPGNVTDGVNIANVRLHNNGEVSDPPRVIPYGTSHLIILGAEYQIIPGSSIKITLDWSLKMPGSLESRTGKAHDSTYFIGYWFPQVAVFDDVSGWDMNNYRGITETYNDRANYNVSIKVPGNYFVWATGDLKNPAEVYSTTILDKIEASKKSEDVIHIITSDDLKMDNLHKPGEFHTWSFEAADVPDFAWAISNNYLWDAVSATADESSNRQTWVSVIYPEEVDRYDMGAEIAKKSIEYFSTVFPGVPFPYNKHISVFGDFQSGMEFPMLANDGEMGADTSDFYDLIAHEIGHTYIPFLVNTNEKMYSWMDESWITMIGRGFVLDQGLNEPPFFEMLDTLAWNSFRDLPPMTPTRNLEQLGFLHQSYVRPKFSNMFLLEMFEEKKLENPLAAYIELWNGKHPTPYDFFFTMDRLFGEDLSWFWKPWYFEFRSPDLAIAGVKKTTDLTKISITNPGKMPLPIALTIYFEDGSIDEIYKSAYIWKDNTERIDFSISSRTKVTTIVLGNNDIPDVKKENNRWTN